MKLLTLSLIAAATIAGCLSPEGRGDTSASARKGLELARAGASISDLCRSFLTRQRECSAVFLPAMIEARVEHDFPPGIAAREAEIGREALMSRALDQYAEGSKDEAIGALCEELAESISRERAAELRRAAGACLDAMDCEELTACAVPLSLERWRG